MSGTFGEMDSTAIFKCEYSPSLLSKDRWLVRDARDGSAVEFYGESNAKDACKRWNENNGNLVIEEWRDAPKYADDSHRGFYTIKVMGVDWKTVIACGWHSDSASDNVIRKLRDAIATHGINAVRDVLEASYPYGGNR